MKSKRKLLLSLLLCCTMVLGMFTVTVSAATADETPQPFSFAVDKTVAKGGDAIPGEETFKFELEYGTVGENEQHSVVFTPDDSVTRAQFVTFLGRYENRPATSGSIAGFTDASSIADPYQQAVAWAVEKGITTGYNDGSFRPNATCTRWAVVLFMYRDMT